MANQITRGSVCLRNRHGFMGLSMSKCALWLPDVHNGKLFIEAVGKAQGRIVSISRGSPPPEER